MDVQAEALKARYGDDTRVVDGSVEDVHGEGGWAVHQAVPRVQRAPHHQVYQLIRAAPHLGPMHQPRSQVPAVLITADSCMAPGCLLLNPQSNLPIVCPIPHFGVQ